MKDFWHGRRLLDAAAMATGVLCRLPEQQVRFRPSRGAMPTCSLSVPVKSNKPSELILVMNE